MMLRSLGCERRQQICTSGEAGPRLRDIGRAYAFDPIPTLPLSEASANTATTAPSLSMLLLGEDFNFNKFSNTDLNIDLAGT